MGRHASVPGERGLTDAERIPLETLDDDAEVTLRQRAVGRVVGALFLRYPNGRANRADLARFVADSLGFSHRSSRRTELRGEHFIRIAAATGYVAYDGLDVTLTDAGRDLAVRSTQKARADQGLAPLDADELADDSPPSTLDEGEAA